MKNSEAINILQAHQHWLRGLDANGEAINDEDANELKQQVKKLLGSQA